MLPRPLFTLCLAAMALRADVTYEESARITGGMLAGAMKMAGVFSKAAREPMRTTHTVKGNKMASVSAEMASLYDLDAKTITTVNHRNKTYSTVTFDEMRQYMDEALGQAKSGQPAPDMRLKVDAKPTGNTRPFQNTRAKETALTVEMQATDAKSGQSGSVYVTANLFLAPVEGYQELRDFQQRMGLQMASALGGAMGAMLGNNADFGRGMKAYQAELAKMEGFPVYSVMRIAPTAGPAPAPAAQPQPEQKPQRRGFGGLGGALGGVLGAPRNEPQQGGQGGGDGALVVMETEVLSVSTAPAIDGIFTLPAGYKEVESEMRKALRKRR